MSTTIVVVGHQPTKKVGWIGFCMIRICRFVVGEKSREVKGREGKRRGKGEDARDKKKVCEGKQSEDTHIYIHIKERCMNSGGKGKSEKKRKRGEGTLSIQ